MNTLISALNQVLPQFVLADVVTGPIIALALVPWILLLALVVCLIILIIKFRKKK